MPEIVTRILKFYGGWRLPFVVSAVVLVYVGLATDSWWSPIVAVLGFVPLLGLYAMTGTRVGDQERRIAEHDVRLEATETRLGHAEDRSVAYEDRFRTIDRSVKTATAKANAAARPRAVEASSTPGAKPVQANANIVTGQILSLYRIATDVEVAPEQPLVTVVIPCFNDARFVGDAIRSIAQQTFANFTCIIVDDCSTDDSVAVASVASAGDGRFHVVRHAINSGLSAARNTGLRLAETEFICFLDSDDFFYADNLEERLRYAIGHLESDDVVGVFSGIEHCDEHTRLGEVGPSRAAAHKFAFHDHLSAAGSCPFNCHAPLLRTEVLQSFGGFDESMRNGAEDWELWQRIMRHGYVFHATPSILAVYRQKAQSMVRSMPGLHLAEAERLLSNVHEPLDADEVFAGTPYVFVEPLGTYQNKLQMAERVLQFIGMVHMNGDTDVLDTTLAQLDSQFWPVVDRHLKVSALLDVGIRRGFALDLEGYRHLDGKISPIRDELLGRLTEQASRAQSPATAVEPRDGYDVVFVPENAAQAWDMISASSLLGEEVSVAMLEVNMMSGASGVAEVLDREWSRDRVGINTWTLTGIAPKVMVVQWPYGPTAATLLGAAAAVGSTTVELAASTNSIHRLEESQSAGTDVRVSTGHEIGALLTSSSSLASMERHSPVDTAALAAVEEYPRLPADIAEIEQFRDRHKGERCVIIGNGPSLNDLELGRLRSENSIGVNGIFYAEALDFPLTYYVVEDTSVMEENLEAIKAYEAGHKFFPTIYRDMYQTDEDNVTFFTMNRGFYAKESPNFCIPRFSTDASQRMFCGQSVTIINLQLAYFMGFTEIYLIGMDFSYTIPDSAERQGDLITSTEDDPNHFHKDYFGKGKTWKDPKLDRVMNNYQLAKSMFEADGRTIYNATAGGKLEIFPRADFHDVFSG